MGVEFEPKAKAGTITIELSKLAMQSLANLIQQQGGTPGTHGNCELFEALRVAFMNIHGFEHRKIASNEDFARSCK